MNAVDVKLSCKSVKKASDSFKDSVKTNDDGTYAFTSTHDIPLEDL